MSEKDFFSLQIVTADFYMEKPKAGLDPCFSEFRAKEIKKVPIIRIFGSNTSGEKTCMHVHGVFPYFYIPYDKKDFETLDKAIYLVASGIDRALNISLGQASSDSLHVFKILLVKGLPMYGYHRNEHQYLKIYMLNPHLIKRTANLLQNGTILGKIFQPHESHVPYLLQFFIDYNLFGMSFIHVPSDILRFRRNADENDILLERKGASNFNPVMEKQSICKLELDISSGFILNRFQIGTISGSKSNPGIEAIWHDERIRRQQLIAESVEVEPLEVPISQERKYNKQTDSEIYFSSALKNKLQQLDQQSNSTINSSMQENAIAEHFQEKKTFNLRKLIANAVYPEEYKEGEVEMTNASFIEDHTFNKGTLASPNLTLSNVSSANSILNSIVDEQQVLSLTQPEIINQSLHEQDIELLDVMQELEDRENADKIDLDSTLAPFSESHDLVHHSQILSGGTSKAAERDSNLQSIDDFDDEDLNDFTMIMDDVDQVISKLCEFDQSESSDKTNLEQCDGSDDMLLTPTKIKSDLEKNTRSPVTPRRTVASPFASPRTPKTRNNMANRYTPLPLVIQSRNNDVTGISSNPLTSAEKKSSKISKKHLKTESGNEKKRLDLDVTHISCNLRSSNKKLDNRLKMYEFNQYGAGASNSTGAIKCSSTIVNDKCDTSDACNHKKRGVEKSHKEINNIKSKSNCKLLTANKKNRIVEKGNNKCPNDAQTHEKATSEYIKADIAEAVLPKNMNKNLMKKLRIKIKRFQTVNEPKHGKLSTEDTNIIMEESNKSENVNRSIINGFLISRPSNTLKCSQYLHAPEVSVVITPRIKPETHEEVVHNCKAYNIADIIYDHPFYSNYTDVTQKKEIGQTVLCIRTKALNDTVDFQSMIQNIKGFNEHMSDIVALLGTKLGFNNRVREILTTEKEILISPLTLPPTKEDIKIWIESVSMFPEKENKLDLKKSNFEEDSPIKIKRRKTVMLMEETAQSDGELDMTMQNLSLTPLTPVNTSEIYLSEGATSGFNFLKTKAEEKIMSSNAKECISTCLQKITTSKALGTYGKLSGKESMNSDISNTTALSESPSASFVRNIQEPKNSLETSFGISIATLNNTYGFKLKLENLQEAKADTKLNYLTILSLEVFVSTREDYLPNPQLDAVSCIFYALECTIIPDSSKGAPKTSGCINVSRSHLNSMSYNKDVEIQIVDSELEAFMKLSQLVGLWDPDIFVGYEIEMSSWGYIAERAKYLKLNVIPLLSRIPLQKTYTSEYEDRDSLTDLEIDAKFCGRILLDVWRLMRSEIALTSYSFENVMYHIMHRRCPLHTHKSLTQWFQEPQTSWIVLDYYFDRVRGVIEILNQLDLIGRTSEMAKLIGIQFYEVLSRGSQFRVESMMLRIAKPKNFVPLSPSVLQRAHMRAPEYLPLILEPNSRFYPDPVIVLDFQSLYPSMIMAYNYCFTTCLGRVEYLGQSTPFEFGASQLRVSVNFLQELLDNDMVTISPCGAVFVKKNIREGILPRMLSEILDTRQMVKQSMKLHKCNTALQRILHSRQLGLKLIANVTYGYTAANFSGRMPCVEVGDSVVSKGRETLERAIKLVDGNKEWNVKVVYGDTDSLFVLAPGKTRVEAFKIGAEIAHQVTQDNPQPVKLKLEKVYQPCILQTKKRYVGYMYETPEQMEPIFEAKGIETVRRDGCPAASKMLEKSLRILFETSDVSLVKNYVCRQFTKLLYDKANIQDLIFAKEFRGLNGYKPTACVPALELTRKWIQSDLRKIPRRGERVPFIVVNGPPGLPLIKLVRSPYDVLDDVGLKINAIYYITKAIIPPLNRCLLLVGADVNEWFAKLPRRIFCTPALSSAKEVIYNNFAKRSTISQYFSSTNCLIDCGEQTQQGVCTKCSLDNIRCLVTLDEKISKLQRGYYLTQMICQVCSGRSSFIDCASLDCPVLFMLERKRRELNPITHFKNFLQLD